MSSILSSYAMAFMSWPSNVIQNDIHTAKMTATYVGKDIGMHYYPYITAYTIMLHMIKL